MGVAGSTPRDPGRTGVASTGPAAPMRTVDAPELCYRTTYSHTFGLVKGRRFFLVSSDALAGTAPFSIRRYLHMATGRSIGLLRGAVRPGLLLSTNGVRLLGTAHRPRLPAYDRRERTARPSSDCSYVARPGLGCKLAATGIRAGVRQHVLSCPISGSISSRERDRSARSPASGLPSGNKASAQRTGTGKTPNCKDLET